MKPRSSLLSVESTELSSTGFALAGVLSVGRYSSSQRGQNNFVVSAGEPSPLPSPMGSK